MKDEIKWTLRLTKEQDSKLNQIAKRQSRTKHGQVIFILNSFITDYEKVNGKIEE